MADEQDKVNYSLNRRIFINALNPKTFLTEDWEFPLKWEDWCIENYNIKRKLASVLANGFRDYHLANDIGSRNWFAEWKIWALHELMQKKCLTEKKKYISISEKLCPSCHQKFKD